MGIQEWVRDSGEGWGRGGTYLGIHHDEGIRGFWDEGIHLFSSSGIRVSGLSGIQLSFTRSQLDI